MEEQIFSDPTRVGQTTGDELCDTCGLFQTPRVWGRQEVADFNDEVELSDPTRVGQTPYGVDAM